jgi:hypothetical protein
MSKRRQTPEQIISKLGKAEVELADEGPRDLQEAGHS